jgi:hypothetical protein
MTVVPLKSAELGRWRLAVGLAVFRLRFRVDRRFGQAKLIAEVDDAGAQTEIEQTVAQALIELDRGFAPEVTDRMADPTAAVVIAIAFRDRLLDLLCEDFAIARSRRGVLDSINTAAAYADALGAALRTVIETDGTAAVLELARRSL